MDVVRLEWRLISNWDQSIFRPSSMRNCPRTTPLARGEIRKPSTSTLLTRTVSSPRIKTPGFMRGDETVRVNSVDVDGLRISPLANGVGRGQFRMDDGRKIDSS